ncbi:MAG: AAA family ATPase [Steroidobacteraceae bacterium]
MTNSMPLLQVYLASRSADWLQETGRLLADIPGIAVTMRNTMHQPLDGLLREPVSPDVVVVNCSDEELGDLDALALLEPGARPTVIACGTLTTPVANRAVVRAGATDLLSASPQRAELQAALGRLVHHSRPAIAVSGRGDTTTVIGAAGGVGATFLACNLAHLAAISSGGRALLIDLDLAYSPMAGVLNLNPERGLTEALQQLASLDAVALEGYIARHESGLGLLAGGPNVTLQERIDVEKFRGLLNLLLNTQGHIFVEGSRWLDGPTMAALEESRHVLVVVNQSVVQVRNAARLYRLLWQQCAVPRERLMVVLNRHSSHSPVQQDMVQRAIGCDTPFVIPEVSELASDSLDGGIPVFDLDRSSELSRTLMQLGRTLGTCNHAEPVGLLRRAMTLFSSKRP